MEQFTQGNFLVKGILRKEKTQANFIITKTFKGYTQRCTDVPGYNRDYVCRENMNQLKKWLQCDLKSFDLISNNE